MEAAACPLGADLLGDGLVLRMFRIGESVRRPLGLGRPDAVKAARMFSSSLTWS